MKWVVAVVVVLGGFGGTAHAIRYKYNFWGHKVAVTRSGETARVGSDGRLYNWKGHLVRETRDGRVGEVHEGGLYRGGRRVQ
jgi:hypothetical protein